MSGGDAGEHMFAEQNFSKEVDDTANSYFQAIYNRGMSVDRLLDELKKFKSSLIRKERVSDHSVASGIREGGREGYDFTRHCCFAGLVHVYAAQHVRRVQVLPPVP